MEKLVHMELGFRTELMCELVIGIVRQTHLSEKASILVIHEEGGGLKDVEIHNDILKDKDPKAVEGSKVLFGMTHRFWFGAGHLGGGPSLRIFQVLHILDGPLAGQTFTYRLKKE